MTQYTRADLALADRHIAEGGQRIARQEILLASLYLNGSPTTEAEKLLRLLNEAQVGHSKHRDAIAAALEEAPGPLEVAR